MLLEKMHESPKNISRKVIPRWRSVKLTPQNEIGGVKNSKAQNLDLSDEFGSLQEKWRIQKNINNASEILFLSSFGQAIPETEEAAKFLLSQDKASEELKAFATTITSQTSLSLLQHEQFKDDPRIYRAEIRGLRRRLGEYPRDAIGHVELARLYASVGQSDKAKEHFRIAVNLANSSRFVLRSAARFHVHEENYEEALKVLRLGSSNDPWLVAAQISIADLAEKPIENWRNGKRLLDNEQDPAQIAELAAAAGTLELKSGKVPLAKKLFKIAAKSPNDNVVAQLQWASKSHGFHFDDALLSRSLTFEAATAHAFLNEKWSDAVAACLKWMFDEPFSVRPAMVGGFLASTAIKDFGLAQMFLRQGLLANPHDAGMLNNLAYSLILSGELREGEEELVKAERYANKQQREVILPATLGLLLYRQGDAAAGANLYIRSIVTAHEMNEIELKHHAFLNFCFEEIRIGHPTPMLDEASIEKLYSSDKLSRRIKVLYELILKPLLTVSKKWGPQASSHLEYRKLLDDAPLVGAQ